MNLLLTRSGLGLTYQYLGERAQADAEFRQGIVEGERLRKGNPTVINVRVRLSRLYNNQGDLQVENGQLADGRRSFERGLELAEEVARQDQAHSDNQSNMGSSLRGIGKALLKDGKPVEALASLEKAVAILAKLPEPDPVDLFDLSRAQAVAAAVAHGKRQPTPAEQDRRARYAEEAVKTLRRAVAAGYRNVPRLRAEVDFNALRQREDFQALLCEAEQQAQRQGE
jgi:tetratricopeptide (TPR) repeat protein